MKKIRVIDKSKPMTVNLVLDGGYSYLKYRLIAENIEVEDKIINAISILPEGFILNDSEIDSVVSFDGIDYCIGQNAILLNPMMTRSENYWKTFYPIIIKFILLKHGFRDFKSIKVNLIIGLNLSDYSKSDDIAASIDLLNTPVYDLFDNTLIAVQGQGIYEDMLEELELDKGLVVVIDGGYYNTSKLVFRDGKLVRGKEDSNNEGLHVLVDYIRKYIKHTYGLTLKDVQINDLLMKEGVFTFQGKPVDLSDKINEYIKQYGEYTKSTLESLGIEDLKTCDKLVLAGGGAYYVYEIFSEAFPHTMMPDEPEFSNTRGYEKMLMQAIEASD